MTLTNGPNLGLLVDGAQGDPHYPELMKLWRWLDFYGQPVVKQVGLNTPPTSPSDGDAYIIGTSPTGVWASLPNRITRWSGVTNTWETFSPKQGWAVKDYATQVEYSWSGTAWAASAYVDSAVVHKAGIETMTALKKINLNTSDLAPLDSATALQIIGSDASSLRLELVCAGSGISPSFDFRSMAGTIASPSATPSGAILGMTSFRGRKATAFSGISSAIACSATETWSDTATGSRIYFYTNPNGSTTSREVGSWGQDGVLSANYGISLPTAVSIKFGSSAAMNASASEGLWIKGATGSVCDFAIVDAANTAYVAQIPIGQKYMKFPQGINLGGTANLTAYDEGTWTPTPTNLGGTGIAYLTKWTRVGNRTDFNVRITGTGLTATALSTFLTLPFTPSRNGTCSVNAAYVTQSGVGNVNTSGLIALPNITSTTEIYITGTLFLN